MGQGHSPTYSGHKLKQLASEGMGELHAHTIAAEKLFRTQEENFQIDPHVITVDDVTKGLAMTPEDKERVHRLVQDTNPEFNAKSQTQRLFHARGRLLDTMKHSMKHVSADDRQQVLKRAVQFWKRNTQTDYGRNVELRWRGKENTMKSTRFVVPLDLIKAEKGSEKAGHKYKGRKPDGKGGWIYEYDHPVHGKTKVSITAAHENEHSVIHGVSAENGGEKHSSMASKGKGEKNLNRGYWKGVPEHLHDAMDNALARHQNQHLLSEVKAGSRVTILTPQGQEVSGKAIMSGPNGWLLDMGDKHGRPGIASGSNIVRVGKAPAKKALTIPATLFKAEKGSEKAGHLYTKRTPDGKGGWKYEYGPALHHYDHKVKKRGWIAGGVEVHHIPNIKDRAKAVERLFPGKTAADHAKLDAQHREAYVLADAHHRHLVESAQRKHFGKTLGIGEGANISGGIEPEFSEHEKDEIRAARDAVRIHSRVAAAHEYASKTLKRREAKEARQAENAKREEAAATAERKYQESRKEINAKGQAAKEEAQRKFDQAYRDKASATKLPGLDQPVGHRYDGHTDLGGGEHRFTYSHPDGGKVLVHAFTRNGKVLSLAPAGFDRGDGFTSSATKHAKGELEALLKPSKSE